MSTGCQTTAAVETLHSCCCLATARPEGGRTAQIFSDCATAFTVNTLSTQEAGQLLPISVTLPAPATLHETPFVDVADGINGIDGDGD